MESEIVPLQNEAKVYRIVDNVKKSLEKRWRNLQTDSRRALGLTLFGVCGGGHIWALPLNGKPIKQISNKFN